MNSGDLLRDFMVVGGVFLLFITVVSLSRRRMTEIFCVGWMFFALLMIIGGILLQPTGIHNYVSETGLILAVVVGALVILAAYWLSVQISKLERENRELAMQVALLAEEQKRMREQMKPGQEQKP